MRNWFDKWAAEKNKRKERGQPGIVEYRDATYVSCRACPPTDDQW